MRNAKPSRALRSTAQDRPGFNEAESPVGWLSRRRDKEGRPLISSEQLAAAERLRADFYFAQMTPRVTAEWSPVAVRGTGRRSAPGAGVEIQDGVLAAAERVHRALGAVGPELAGILIDVCCHLKGLEETERRADWPQRTAKIILRMALNSLARHYGLLGHHNAHRQEGKILHWGAAGYRPQIAPDEDGAA
jgi:hypothetical protein